jgi:hypothetical protein
VVLKTIEKVSIICVFSLLMVARILVVNYQILEPFTYSILANAATVNQSGHLAVNPYNLSGWWQTHANFLAQRAAPILIYTMLSNTMGVSIFPVAQIPLLGFMMILLCFVLARRITKSVYAGLAFTLIINLDFLTNLVYTSFSYHQLGLILHLAFLFVLYEMLSSTRVRRRVWYAVLIILFVAIFYSYYSFEFLTLVFVASLLILAAIVHYRTGANYGKGIFSSLLGLVFFMGIIFFGFDSIVSKLSEISSTGFGRLFELITGALGRATVTRYNPSFSASYLTLKSLDFDLMLLVLAILVPYFVYSLFARRTVAIENIFVLSLLTTSLAELLTYTSLGSAGNTRYFVKLVPLAIIIIITRLRIPFKSDLTSFRHFVQSIVVKVLWLRKTIVPLMLLLTVLATYLAVIYPASYQYVGGLYLYSSVSPSSTWICDNAGSKASFVAPHHSAAVMMFVAASQGKADSISVNQYDKDAYIFLDPNETSLKGLFQSNGYDYMAIQRQSETLPFYGAFSIVLPPLNGSVSKIEAMSCVNKLFDDGNNLVFGKNLLTLAR